MIPALFTVLILVAVCTKLLQFLLFVAAHPRNEHYTLANPNLIHGDGKGVNTFRPCINGPRATIIAMSGYPTVRLN
jgi:hypothetical protein